jgi:DNA-binding response OmpR family regulator
MRLLIVEDDLKGARFLKKGLEEEFYVVDVAEDGIKALTMIEQYNYDLIILDLMLPGKDGLEVCREMRKRHETTPIIMVTARDSTEEKVVGLDHGADDYLTKPFEFAELLARVRALLRRQSVDRVPSFKVGDLELDPVSRCAKRGGKTVQLTAKEYTLLEHLMRNPGRIVPRNQLLMHVWKEPFESFTNVVDVTISNLRKKIDAGHDRKLIRTGHGVGYGIGLDKEGEPRK